MISISKSILLLTLVSYVSATFLNDNHEYGDMKYDEYDRPGATVDEDILSMVKKMTVEEKIGQMTQINQDLVLSPDGKLNRTAVKMYAQKYYVGSYLNQLARYFYIVILDIIKTNASLLVMVSIMMLKVIQS